MSEIKIDFSRRINVMKPMNCVNNGPIKARAMSHGNFENFKAAAIPYVRNHDASFWAAYGGEHTVDIRAVFPDFNRDADDPTAYDFTLTDLYLKTILDAGAQVFYRLGSKIEHIAKKYGTLPPPDFHKWAVVCEHIIAHYNEGWANGFHWNILYWEIWNEADLDLDDAPDKRTWGGTAKEYYELYRITATHLKKRFPHLKIGGPALAFRHGEWLDGFLAALTADGEKVPMDFFSWHMYTASPHAIQEREALLRAKLNKAGYTQIETNLNEYNYLKNWGDKFYYTIESIIGLKGAAFTAAAMCAGQDSTLNMMMYYDARPCIFNGLFDFYTLRPLKGYYSLIAFSELYRLGTQKSCESTDDDLYALAAEDEAGNEAVLICYYNDDDNPSARKFRLTNVNGDFRSFRVRILDQTRNLEDAQEINLSTASPEIELQPYSVLLLTRAGKEIPQSSGSEC